MYVRERVKVSVRSGKIVLIRSEDEENNTQILMIEKNLTVVKKNTTVYLIARIVRLIGSDNHCDRNYGEPTKIYIRSFKDPSLDYLNTLIESEDS